MDIPQTPSDSERIQAVEKRLERFTALEEEILTHKVYRAAYDKLVWIIKLFTAVAVVVAAAIGYQSYREIVKEGSQQAAQLFAEQAITALANEARRQANEQLSTLSAEFRAGVNAKVDQQAAEIFALYQQKFDEALKKVAAPATPRVQVQGFVLYGEGRKDEKGTWLWESRNFDIEGGDKEAVPQVGATALTQKPAVVREQPPTVTFTDQKITTRVPAVKGLKIEFRDQIVSVAKIPKLEDRGGSPVATLLAGQPVKVEEVQVLLDRFLWVKVTTQR